VSVSAAMVTATVHVVGGGLAGLSAALHAADAGAKVRLHEGAGQLGGRCRSFHDAALDRRIDNGNHLVLSGNLAVKRYLALAGAEGALREAPEAAFPFYDLSTGERWHVRMNDGVLPWWVLSGARRPLGVGAGAMAAAGRILLAGPKHTISGLVRADGPAVSRFWEPMSFAVMNLPPHEASAALMRATALGAWRDGRLARPMFAPEGLGEALVVPAARAIEEKGGELRTGAVLKEIVRQDGRASALRFAGGEEIALGPEDRVVLALPPQRLNALMPETDAPEECSAILNAHFVVEDESLLDGAPPLLGLVGGIAQWVFVRGDVVSLTISSAQDVEGAEEAPERLVPLLWSEIRAALALPEGTEPKASRLIREKRATFKQTPENVARRPKTRTALRNVFLAGDTVDTGLPATIEGAVLSGERAAREVLERG
jgi:squalene-associated FAD-dependent desaturase